MNAGLVELQQFDLFLFFASAEDDAECGLLFRFLLMLGEPAKIELHLAFIVGLEVAEFEVDCNEAFESTMVEEEIDIEIFGVDLDADLTAKKREATTELQQEGFELAQDGVFEVFFKIAVFETEEIENVGIAKYEVGCELIFAVRNTASSAWATSSGFLEMAVRS